MNSCCLPMVLCSCTGSAQAADTGQQGSAAVEQMPSTGRDPEHAQLRAGFLRHLCHNRHRSSQTAAAEHPDLSCHASPSSPSSPVAGSGPPCCPSLLARGLAQRLHVALPALLPRCTWGGSGEVLRCAIHFEHLQPHSLHPTLVCPCCFMLC